jgi:hypothetical protein
VTRSWAAAIVVLVALTLGAVAVALSAGSDTSASIKPGLGLAYATGSAGSSPEIWFASADGRNGRLLGPGTTPLLAPNGGSAAASATTEHGAALTIYSTGTAAPRRLFDAARVTARAQAWSPDSRYLAVTLTGRDPISAGGSGLAVIDFSTGAVRVLATGAVSGASFASDGSDQLAYAIAPSRSLTAPVNVYAIAADGSHRRPLTHDGASLNPVWGRAGIAYDRERRRPNALPAYQLWLMNPTGGGSRRLAGVVPPPLGNGLVPIAFSAGGGRLLAEYEGVDTSQAWTVAIGDRRAHELRVGGHSVVGASISSDGATVLVDRGAFLVAPSAGMIESLPFGGGPPHVLVVHGSDPSWNL